MRKKLTLLTLILMGCVVVSTFAQIPQVYDVENRGATCAQPPLPHPDDLPNYPFLPDPFAWSDGSGLIDGFDDWSCRRNEIMAEIMAYEIGPKPPRPENITATLVGDLLTVSITENSETLVLTSTVVIPEGEGPFPVVIGMNSGTGSLAASLFEGVIQVPFMHNQVVTSSHQGERDPDAAYFRLYPELEHVGYYSAWSWGISRLIDGLEIVQEDLKANLERIAVSGCSYGGKMALFAGAFDERIALTIAQESGGGGINAWRVAEALERNVEKIDNTNYSWFMQSMKTNFGGRVGNLPHDHHELMAMIVPRALIVLGNPEQEWLGDEAGFVACKGAEKVYEAFGLDDRFGYSFRGNHGHCVLPDQSIPEVQAFIDKFLHGDETAETTIRVTDTFLETVVPDFWINWPVNADAPEISIVLSEPETVFESPASFSILSTIPDPVNPIEKVVLYEGNTILEEITEAPFTFSFVDVNPGMYSYYAVAYDSEALRGFSNILNITVQAPPQAAYKTSTPPIIDGVVDGIWMHEKVGEMNADIVLLGGEFTDDIVSGYSKMLWDDEFVYLLAVVTDAVLVNDGPAIYQDDNVEFYFDINHSKGSSYDTDDVQYTFRWDDLVIGSIPDGYSKEGLVFKILETTAGYNVEAKIPWATLKGSPEGAKTIGFDFMINDDDTGGDRERKLAWNATADQAWQTPSYFGTVILTDDDVLVSNGRTIKTNNVSVHPNPAQNDLFVSGFEKDFAYQVIDLAGIIHLSGKSGGPINIESIAKGTYMLYVSNNYSHSHFKFIKN